MSISFSVNYETPKELAIALASADDESMLFCQEVVEHLDYFACSTDFTLNAANYFIDQILSSDITDHSMEVETEIDFYRKGIELGKRCEAALRQLETEAFVEEDYFSDNRLMKEAG